VSDVLVLGDLNPDLVLRGDVVPRFGQTEQLLDAADLVLGGSAAITAHALARLGRSTRVCALTGCDTFGDAAIELLTAQGVDTEAVVRDPTRPTGLTVVLSKGQERAVLTFLGTIATLSADQAMGALESAAADGARHLHVTSFFLQRALAPGLAAVLERAHVLGLSTSVDPNFDPAQRWDGVQELLPHLDVMLPNRAEALAIAGRIAGHSFDDPAEAGRLLASRGPVVVITDGRNGALQVTSDGSVLRDTGTPVDAVDTTGAGDTFASAYIDSRLRGLPAHECLRRAVVAGALSTAGVGGTAGQPTLDQLVQPALEQLGLTRDPDVARQ
jgi:ribokinase